MGGHTQITHIPYCVNFSHFNEWVTTNALRTDGWTDGHTLLERCNDAFKRKVNYASFDCQTRPRVDQKMHPELPKVTQSCDNPNNKAVYTT